MAQEAHRQTDLERLGALGLEVVNREPGLGAPVQAALVPAVTRVGEVTLESHTHRCVRRTEFDVGEVLRHLGDELRQHDRSTDRGIEKRALHRMLAGQLRRPVVTAGQREEVGVLKADLNRGEDRLGLLAPPFLQPLGLGGVAQVLHAEHVGQQRFFVGDLTVGNRAAHLHGVVAHVRDRSTGIGLQRPVLAKSLVDIDQHVAVDLLVLGLRDAVEAVFRTLGQLREGRSIEFFRIVVVAVVDAETAGNIEPVEHVVRECSVQHVTVFVVFAQVAVVDPIGVLHRHAGIAHGPVLRIETAGGIVTLVHLDIAPVIAARKDISADQRVVVGTLVGHVAVFLHHIAGTHVEFQFVVEERGGIAEREVVSVVTVVGDDTARIDRRGREIGLVLFGTCRERHALGTRYAGLKIVVAGIVAHVVGTVQAVAPTADERTLGRIEVARTVTVLEIGKDERGHHLRAARNGHRSVARLAALGRDDDGTVGGIRTVERSRGRTVQHRHRLDVLGVDVGNGIGRTLRGELRAAVAGRREHRHAVDHVEGVRRLRDRFLTAHDDLRGTADAARRRVDRHTGDLAAERIDEVDVLVGYDVFGIDLLHVVRQRLFRAFDTEGRNHDRVHIHRRLPERKGDVGAAAYGLCDRFVA